MFAHGGSSRKRHAGRKVQTKERRVLVFWNFYFCSGAPSWYVAAPVAAPLAPDLNLKVLAIIAATVVVDVATSLFVTVAAYLKKPESNQVGVCIPKIN